MEGKLKKNGGRGQKKNHLENIEKINRVKGKRATMKMGKIIELLD